MRSPTDQDVQRLGCALFEAERDRKQLGLVSTEFPDISLERAYDIQDAFVDLKLASGDAHTGWKIGLTSKAMQRALGIDTPDSGYLLRSMEFDDGAVIPAGRFIEPRVEVELAFVMASDLPGEGIGASDVLIATDFICPSIEILDTRVERLCSTTSRTRAVFDTVSDNAANAGYILGPGRISPKQTDLNRIGASLLRNGEVEETGLGAGVLNNPALSIVWLANRLASVGHTIKAGQVLLSGSFIRPVEAMPGSTIVADFGPFGTVSASFSDEADDA